MDRERKDKEDVEYMRIFDKEHKLTKVVCNQCRKSSEVSDGILKADYFSAEKSWGYFSGRDTQVHYFDLCEACYDRLIAGFAIPVEIKHHTELM